VEKEKPTMGFKVSLDKKKIWMLAIILIFLVICTFVAGWLMGVIVSYSPEAQQAPIPEKNERLIRQKIPAQPVPQKNETIDPVKSPAVSRIIKPPAIHLPKVSLPKIAIVKKPVAAVKTIQRTISPLKQKPMAKDNNTPPADAAAVTPVPDSGTEEKEEPVETAAAQEPEGTYPYSLRLASYRDGKRAVKSLDDYRKRGLSPHVVKVDLSGMGIWYRIYSGYYGSQQEAMADRDKHDLKDAEIIRTRWANRIGIYDDETGADSMFDRLASKGHHPYVVRSGTGRFLIYVGAFLTRRGAEMQQQDLAGQDIESQTVQR
jgi:hypothetical protein